MAGRLAGCMDVCPKLKGREDMIYNKNQELDEAADNHNYYNTAGTRGTKSHVAEMTLSTAC